MARICIAAACTPIGAGRFSIPACWLLTRTREECTAERTRSNTPTQALVLLNDPVYVEAARVLAERMIRRGARRSTSGSAGPCAARYRRRATAAELQVLGELHDRHWQHYATGMDEARKLIAIGETPVPSDIDAADLAAWTSVARAILNLHETITRY